MLIPITKLQTMGSCVQTANSAMIITKHFTIIAFDDLDQVKSINRLAQKLVVKI